MKANQYHSFNINNYKNEYLKDRKNIINSLRNLHLKLKFQTQIFYLAIYYMDVLMHSIHSCVNSNLITETNKLDLELFAVSCLVMAGKYLYN